MTKEREGEKEFVSIFDHPQKGMIRIEARSMLFRQEKPKVGDSVEEKILVSKKTGKEKAIKYILTSLKARGSFSEFKDPLRTKLGDIFAKVHNRFVEEKIAKCVFGYLDSGTMLGALKDETGTLKNCVVKIPLLGKDFESRILPGYLFAKKTIGDLGIPTTVTDRIELTVRDKDRIPRILSVPNTIIQKRVVVVRYIFEDILRELKVLKNETEGEKLREYKRLIYRLFNIWYDKLEKDLGLCDADEGRAAIERNYGFFVPDEISSCFAQFSNNWGLAEFEKILKNGSPKFQGFDFDSVTKHRSRLLVYDRAKKEIFGNKVERRINSTINKIVKEISSHSIKPVSFHDIPEIFSEKEIENARVEALERALIEK